MRSAALRLKRWRARRGTAVADPLLHCWQVPPPPSGTRLRNLKFLVCDGEMSGLNPATDALISLGWVSVQEGEIALASAEHHLLQTHTGVGHSATIHRLRDCELQDAAPPAQALERLLVAARGRVLVFHHAALDMGFLDRACAVHFGAPLMMPVVDTLALEHRRMARRGQPLEPGSLRLPACRERHALPAHSAHNALDDALATAELLLAQIAHAGNDLCLRDLN